MSIDTANTDSTFRVDPDTTEETVTLRPATLADCDALALIGAATFLEAFTWMLPGSEIVAYCKEHHTAEGYAAYLAKPNTRITIATAGPFPHDQAPVGFAMVCDPELPTIETHPTDIELKRIYIFSRFRSVPIDPATEAAIDSYPGVRPAQALLDLAIANGRALGRTRLLLGVNDGNRRALNFYHRNQFATIGKRPFQVGSLTCSDLILAKDL
jgi:hypothetical protein